MSASTSPSATTVKTPYEDLLREILADGAPKADRTGTGTRSLFARQIRYDLSEDAAPETAMIFSELYRNGAEWKFRAVGQGYTTGLAGIATDFGVQLG